MPIAWQLWLREDRDRHVRAAPRLLPTAMAIILAACNANVPIPSASPVPPTPRWSDVIRIGLVSPAAKLPDVRNPGAGPSVFEAVQGPWIGPAAYPLSNELTVGVDIEAQLVARFLFRALYRLDEELRPVPDLAEDYCDADDTRKVWTCRLRSDVAFSNGDPVRAEDVKFSFDLARSTANPFGVNFLDFEGGNLLARQLVEVEVVDRRIVKFTLAEPDPSFETMVLPYVWIDPEIELRGQFDTFRESATRVGATALRRAAEEAATGLRGPNPDCDEVIGSGGLILTRAGVELPPKAMYEFGPERDFDACRYAREVVRDSLFTSANSADVEGFEALARAYPILPHRLHPVGAGVWMINEAASEPGRSLVLVPSPGAETQPATNTIEFNIFGSRRRAAEAFIAGEIDWLPIPARRDETQGGPELYRFMRDSGAAQFAEHVEGGTEALYFNLREGRLFHDRNLRRALQQCIDKPGIVNEATDGQGLAVEGSIQVGLWASNPNLQPVPRDVNEGRRLIESSGWRWVDGMYEKDGLPLRTEIWAGTRLPERLAFAKLVATQAGDCGIDLRVHEAPFEVMGALSFYPFTPTGEAVPADLWVYGSLDSGVVAEPVDEGVFDSRNIATKEHPYEANTTGYTNDKVDQLLDEARGTYNLSERAELYRQEQAILAGDQPMLFGWQRLFRAALRPGMTTVDGPLNLKALGWDWQLERIVVPAKGG